MVVDVNLSNEYNLIFMHNIASGRQYDARRDGRGDNMIIKVQLNAAGDRILIYNRRRTVTHEVPAEGNEGIVKLLKLAPLHKTYARATLSKDKMLVVHRRINNQNW